MVRLFISVDITDQSILKKIKLFQSSLSQFSLRMVKTDIIHATIKFIGEKEEGWISKIVEELKNINFSSFDLELEGSGMFPPKGNPRVVWVGINKGKEEILELANKIDDAMAKLGIPKEKRSFSPHLTIARTKRDKNYKPLAPFLSKNPPDSFGTIKVSEFHLKKSTLTPKGPIYETLSSFSAIK